MGHPRRNLIAVKCLPKGRNKPRRIDLCGQDDRHREPKWQLRVQLSPENPFCNTQYCTSEGLLITTNIGTHFNISFSKYSACSSVLGIRDKWRTGRHLHLPNAQHIRDANCCVSHLQAYQRENQEATVEAIEKHILTRSQYLVFTLS